jgi:diaminopimelate decarboxylase
MMQADLSDWIHKHREELRTPLYVYSEASLVAAHAQLRALLPPRSEVFYSLKANPQPALAKVLHSCGARPEIASEGELYMCAVAAIPSQEVLIGGVSKSLDYMRRVCAEGCFAVTVDSLAEWRLLRDLKGAHAPVRILVRISPGIALGGLDMGGDSQFGVAVDEAVAIARECASTAHEFLGIHLYLGSQRLKSEPIVGTVRIATSILRSLKELGVVPKVADVGLGCGVPYLERDTELDLSEVRRQLGELWLDPAWSDTQLWTEAGRSLVARSGWYVTRVLGRKQLHGKDFVFVDGGLQTHNPGVGLGKFFRSNPRFVFPGHAKGSERRPVEIVGNLCTAADRIGVAIQAPNLAEGDLVVIPNSGAYCQTTGMWGFNSQRPFSEAILTAAGKLRYLEPQYLPLFRAYAGASGAALPW